MTEVYEYARALFMLSEEEHTTEKVYQDICIVRDAFIENPGYASLLDTPAISKADRVALIDEAFSALDTSLVNLIKILAERRLSYTLVRLADDYSALYDEAHDVLRAEAVSAVALTDEQKARLTKKLSSLTGKTVILKTSTDKSLLGGVKLRYSGIQLDGSVKTRLDKFESALKETVV